MQNNINQNNNSSKSSLSIAGFICSLCGFITCGLTSIVGLILSIIGLTDSKKKGKSDGLAIAGIVISVIPLAIGMLLFIIGVASSSDTNKKDEKPEVTTKNNEINKKASIAEQTILDKGGIKVTAKSISYDGWGGPKIKVLIENNSSENVTIQARKFSINGIMIDPVFSADVAAGKKINDSISILQKDLDTAKIKTIKDIEFGLHVFNSDTWEEMFDENDIKITTDAKNYVQEYNTAGTLSVDQNGVKIYVLKKDDKESFWGADIYVYIENNTNENITVQVRDESINGFMVDPVFSSDICAGKKSYDKITFFESDLKDNGIEDITDIELKFKVFNQDTWNDIFETDIKKISFK